LAVDAAWFPVGAVGGTCPAIVLEADRRRYVGEILYVGHFGNARTGLRG
jgi:hypothetical protein